MDTIHTGYERDWEQDKQDNMPEDEICGEYRHFDDLADIFPSSLGTKLNILQTNISKARD